MKVDYQTKIEYFAKLLSQGNVVFFGGAGVSTESGIPDFRSQNGLYNEEYAYPPEQIVSHTFFKNNTSAFYRFYKDKMLFPKASPNACHKALAKLEEEGKLTAVITQNIDGLHQRAGSMNVLELHGSVWRNFCMRCKKGYSLDYVKNAFDVPQCDCGGIVKPDVVLYEESLDNGVVMRAVDEISGANTLIVGGTSLVVYPASGLLRYFRGSHIVVINRTPTSADDRAELLFTEDIGQVFQDVMKID
ncbi:MAG: NAD-dependent protein deacylase [Clostridia bacterium]|nr:NAD-dependent protein deacylase [Clostridia bacterium]